MASSLELHHPMKSPSSCHHLHLSTQIVICCWIISNFPSNTSNTDNRINDISSMSNAKLCPLSCHDCREDKEVISLEEHYITESHQKILVNVAQQLIEKENHDKKTEQLSAGPREYCERLSAATDNTEALNDETLQLSSNTLLLSHQCTTLSEDINNVKLEIASQQDHIKAISINQTILTQDCNSIKQQVDHENARPKHQILDGTMIWKISNVREKIYDSKSERQPSVYSPPFYTSGTGYKLSVRLYLNGDGTARGSHMSIFLVVLRGEFDALLHWPFSYRVSFCLFDQRAMLDPRGPHQAKHVIESFRPDINSASFQRPRSALNIASGLPKFLPLANLDEPAGINRYVINDTLFIKVLIDFVGVPKSILPFIFDLNIALPIQIQQKLLDEEMKQRNESNHS